jgi:hypothetical protein
MALLSRSATLCQPVQVHPDVFRAVKHDVSPPLRDIKPAPPVPGPPRVMQRLWARPPKITPAQRDTVLQTSQGPRVSATAGPNFEGINEVSQQIASGLLAVPPDTNAAVGETQIVQWVNYAFAVFDKSTGLVQPGGGPFAGNYLWTGFGEPCETTNSGDPVAQYDKAVGRWVLTQPVFTNNPFAICVAVSQTSDARGAYYRYAFKVPNFPDYPKLGIWPDAYYVSMDLYKGQGFGGKFTVGVRWYEIRNPNGITPTVFQHGTFAPNDRNFRWMGSAAMDKFGDIAVGYSVSGSSINPQIRFTGRVPSDPLGMLEVETHMKDGTGSQLKLSNWGDYSSMSIDPVDDCTFWYTTEYLQTDGKYNWRTRIASFKFQPCY